MRRVGGILLALVCVGLLSSCSLLPKGPSLISDDSQHAADAQMQHIADAVKHHDAVALKGLFSLRAREKAPDLDGGVKYFLSVFPSGRMTWKSGTTNTSDHFASGKKTEELSSSYTVFANGKKYDLAFIDYPLNQVDDPKNVGLSSLGVAISNPDFDSAAGRADPYHVWLKSSGPGIYVPPK